MNSFKNLRQHLQIQHPASYRIVRSYIVSKSYHQPYIVYIAQVSQSIDISHKISHCRYSRLYSLQYCCRDRYRFLATKIHYPAYTSPLPKSINRSQLRTTVENLARTFIVQCLLRNHN
jgi:predicted membrane-bound spermidine synthase